MNRRIVIYGVLIAIGLMGLTILLYPPVLVKLLVPAQNFYERSTRPELLQGAPAELADLDGWFSGVVTQKFPPGTHESIVVSTLTENGFAVNSDAAMATLRRINGSCAVQYEISWKFAGSDDTVDVVTGRTSHNCI